MIISSIRAVVVTAFSAALLVASHAQQTPEPAPTTGRPAPPRDGPGAPPPGPPPEDFPFRPGAGSDRPPRGFGRAGGFGMQQPKKLVAKFDENGDKRLNAEERKAARAHLAEERAKNADGRPPRRMGPPRGGDNAALPEPGAKLAPDAVKTFATEPFYDAKTLRTLFLSFENPDWEKELEDFKGSDVEVPATLTVDGKTYKDVGVHFRGASSFMMVGEGRKRSLNLSLDFVHEDQRLAGYRTLNLLNSNGDPTFTRAVLFNRIAREYIPAPQTNFARVAINGEDWGIYVNVQQFNKDFTDEWFGSKKGARWKAPGRPGGNSGLEYLGKDVAEYKKRFEIKSKDDEKSWAALIELCRVLNETPPEKLQEALSPHLNVDGALRFLALENVFINTDGYWTRASDFNLYRDESGRFHIIPHDTNETFRTPEGPGMRRAGGDGGNPLHLDPFAGADDSNKPLLNKLLAVPSLRARYSQYVREIAERWLDWARLGPIAEQSHALIADVVKADTRKLSSFEAFTKGLTEDVEQTGPRGPRRTLSLKSFVEQRRAYLLEHPEIRASIASNKVTASPAKP